MTVRDRMAWAVIALWMLVVVAALVTKDSTLAIVVTPVAMTVLGFYFGARGGPDS